MEQMNPYLKDVMSYVEKTVGPSPAKFDVVNVKIDCQSKTFVVYVDELYSNIMMALSLRGGTLSITKNDFISYCENLVRIRIDYVNRRRIGIGPTERIVIPSYLSLLLTNIGLARHLDYGLELQPEYSEIKVLSDDHMRSISNALKLLKGIGFEYAEGYSRDREGSFDFMAFALIDGMVYTITKDSHPVYALLACTLGIRGVESVLSPRVTYGSESHLMNLVKILATLKV